MTPIVFIRTSIANRARFLREQRTKWQSSNELKRNKIIVELVRLSFSHMETKWIAAEVARWRQDFEKNKDHLDRAFGGKPLDYLSAKEKQTRIETAMLSLRIDIESFVNEISRKEALKNFVTSSEDDSLPGQAETALKKRIQRHKKTMIEPPLPRPYFGNEVKKRGNQIEIFAPLGSLAVFNGYVNDFQKQISHTPIVITSAGPMLSVPLPRELGPNGEIFDLIINKNWPDAF